MNDDLTRRAVATVRLEPLDRLRLRLTAWYVATTAAILLVLGGALFLAVAHEIGAELDRTLEESLAQVVDRGRSIGGGSTPVSAGEMLSHSHHSLYVLDSTGAPLRPDSASAPVRAAAAIALRVGTAAIEEPTGEEEVVRVRAQRFRSEDGTLLVGVAAAGLEDLEDRYLRLITQFVMAAVLAVALSAIGGMALARYSARPVEASVAHMRRFMADAAHELRTPVTVLRTEAEVARQRPRSAVDDERAFSVLALESMRLTAVVDDIFTLARAESAELPVERDPVFLDDIVSNAVLAGASRAKLLGVSLALTDFDEARLIGSATLLARLVAILLDNSLKYTPSGGQVTAAVRNDRGRIVLTISDTGIGIPADVLPRVFDRFVRGDAARASSDGAGLGLSIAQWIAEVHGGTLELSSDGEGGTVARFIVSECHVVA